MSLKSLVLCSDEKIVRVLRRVLGDLDIEVDTCGDSDAALRNSPGNDLRPSLPTAPIPEPSKSCEALGALHAISRRSQWR